MTRNKGAEGGSVRGTKRPRDMALVSVSLIAISLVWAGTHQVGMATIDGSFNALEWTLAVGLLVAGGFLFTSLVISVDIRTRLDLWIFLVLGGVPMAVLAYTLYSRAVGELRVLDKVLGWANPYGTVAMAVLIGFAGAAAFRVPTPTPVVTDEGISTLSIPD